MKTKIATLSIATAPRRDSRKWTQGTITWDEIVAWLDTPSDQKEAGNYLLGELSNGRRKKETIISRSALSLDADSATPDLPTRVEMLLPWAVAMHTTYSSSDKQPKYRILIPVDRPLLPDEYRYAVTQLMHKLGWSQFDHTCAEPERYMFRPAAKNRSHYDRWVFDGPPATAAELLEGWDTDLSDHEIPKHIGQNKADPLTAPGPIGAFNRAYSIQEAIDAFELPYVTAGEGRWSLVGAASVAGLNLITEHLVFSHHATDPAYGRASSAFDLVRLHKFGSLDDDSKENTPINRLPSHDAMLKLAVTDHRAVRELTEPDFGQPMDEPEEDPEDDSWRDRLVRRPSNGKVADRIDNWELIKTNDRVFRSISHNELSGELELWRAVPWRSDDTEYPTPMKNSDRHALYHYLERTYEIRAPRYMVDELLSTLENSRSHNPIIEYLNALEWDGVPRVEECLPGVTPTDYTRMVARKSLVSAVARIMNPGCKWDHVLVLYGQENLGKSYWIDRIARGYSNTLGPIDSKDTLMAMQRSWIMVSDEGYSLKKGDADQQKEFLTRTHDAFRKPYAVEAERRPRHSVIWSTTNDETFLRRQQGNRRYLIVRCEMPVDFDTITDEYIDQLWAEAVQLYRQGEKLYLTADEAALSALEREHFTEEEPLVGLVYRYVNTLVPSDWEEMSIESRKMFLDNVADGMARGEKLIRSVCSLQIWVEALGNDIGKQRRSDLLPITNVLKNLPGWRYSPQEKTPMGPYGPQVAFNRDSR